MASKIDYNADDQFSSTGARLDQHLGRPNGMGSGWPKRKPDPLKTKAGMSQALLAHERILAVSTEIRKRAGLAPLQLTGYIERNADGETLSTRPGVAEELRAKVGTMPAPKAKRKAAPKSQAPLSAVERVAAIARRRREIERDREALDAEVKALVAEPTVSVVSIAKALGVSRQRVYQLAG